MMWGEPPPHNYMKNENLNNKVAVSPSVPLNCSAAREGQITRFIPAQPPQQSTVFIEGQGWQILQTYKPKEIWCNMWSTHYPFLVITEYLDDNKIKVFCNADSEPQNGQR